MTTRRLLGNSLALCVALSLACSEERTTAPATADVSPSFSRQSAAPSARFYAQHNLVSDGAVSADHVDAALVNAWGLAASATSPWWVADNGTDSSTLYNGNTGATIALRVGVAGAPTGVVFNGGASFVVTNGTASGPARFIFATESGTIAGWSPAVAVTRAALAVDNSAAGAVYKGLAIATTASGERLYATNFHAGTVDVFDAAFHPVPGGFSDGALPPGYAPFGIRNLGGTIYVTYALQDADAHDDVAGVGHGFVDAFDTQGNLLRRVASRGRLNSPWGLAVAPSDFGEFSGNLLVGNFGDGHINAFDLGRFEGTGELVQRGQLHATDGRPLTIDGLWALAFGNGAAAGPTNALFFTAGPFGEQHGLFGKVVTSAVPD
ncbi:MAG TPA: TIGR03118 family protein [Gemmatimonadales bacterium]|nr:TIGR03118 family protein [Gemmatimonadales bacterium]